MKSITIEGQLRTGFGKSATRQLRSQGLVPGVIYGGEKEINFTAPAPALKNLVYTPSFQLAEVVIEGKTYRTILKDLQFDKVNDHLIHIDLLELVDNKKVIADISSGAALKGYYGWSLYCAAKAGMENFIHSLAVEQQTQPHPFLPINIDPGVIDTDMQALIRATPQSDFADVERFIQRKNQGLLVSPDKVAASIINIIELPSLSFGNRYETSKYNN